MCSKIFVYLLFFFVFEGHARFPFRRPSRLGPRPLLPPSRWSCPATARTLASSSSCRFLGVFPIARSWRFLPPDPAGSGRRSYSPMLARTVLLARCAALKECCPPRQKSRVERLKEKVGPRLTQVTVDHKMHNEKTHAALEATQGQNDSFFNQLPYKCYLEEAASVGD